jgi:hypothetical protein
MMSLTSARGWRRLRDLLGVLLLIATISYGALIVVTCSPIADRVAAQVCPDGDC